MGKDVVILGAGFSKGIHEAFPVLSELAERVKEEPRFLDAFAALWRCLWSERFSTVSSPGALIPKIIHGLPDTLTRGA